MVSRPSLASQLQFKKSNLPVLFFNPQLIWDKTASLDLAVAEQAILGTINNPTVSSLVDFLDRDTTRKS